MFWRRVSDDASRSCHVTSCHVMSFDVMSRHLLPVPAPRHDGVRVHAGVGDGHQAGALHTYAC